MTFSLCPLFHCSCIVRMKLSLLPTMSISTPPRMVRLFLELWGSLPRLMQGMDMRSIPTAGRPRIEPVIMRARVVWM